MKIFRIPIVLGVLYLMAIIILIYSGDSVGRTGVLFSSVSHSYFSLDFPDLFLLFVKWPLIFLSLQWVWLAPGFLNQNYKAVFHGATRAF